ncbi:MAG: hypothetical protein H0A76_13285 [Candidatus Thiodubiliella endoseptemdiera]|uniref:Uncharacterized protein n=1 Tax=Candidatus Thiodubiliella endoseptemdiera TaxID=2738886 RepID=A0A853F5S3_9GAMM|nr:hypothetical protein [Candidatus Thiodubiliella endoseptemdiera]
MIEDATIGEGASICPLPHSSRNIGENAKMATLLK